MVNMKYLQKFEIKNSETNLLSIFQIVENFNTLQKVQLMNYNILTIKHFYTMGKLVNSYTTA